MEVGRGRGELRGCGACARVDSSARPPSLGLLLLLLTAVRGVFCAKLLALGGLLPVHSGKGFGDGLPPPLLCFLEASPGRLRPASATSKTHSLAESSSALDSSSFWGHLSIHEDGARRIRGVLEASWRGRIDGDPTSIETCASWCPSGHTAWALDLRPRPRGSPHPTSQYGMTPGPGVI